MAKICFPDSRKIKHASLQDAIKYMKRRGYMSSFALCDIVQYNVCYRDHLRMHGMDSLISRLLEEAPVLKDENMQFVYLREFVKEDDIAEYDIICCDIKDKVTIHGHTFDGLKDIRSHVEARAMGLSHGFHYCGLCEGHKEGPVHVAEIYDLYPTFDEFDVPERRFYENFIFSTSVITKDDLRSAYKTPHFFNFCMVHEDIPSNKLPILYYGGKADYMLLAIEKGAEV